MCQAHDQMMQAKAIANTIARYGTACNPTQLIDAIETLDALSADIEAILAAKPPCCGLVQSLMLGRSALQAKVRALYEQYGLTRRVH